MKIQPKRVPKIRAPRGKWAKAESLVSSIRAPARRWEIPDSGELKATHPMKITNIGKTGELKGGDELFTYQKPTDEEVEKSKKAREQGKDVKEIDETKAQAQGDNDMKK